MLPSLFVLALPRDTGMLQLNPLRWLSVARFPLVVGVSVFLKRSKLLANRLELLRDSQILTSNKLQPDLS